MFNKFASASLLLGLSATRVTRVKLLANGVSDIYFHTFTDFADSCRFPILIDVIIGTSHDHKLTTNDLRKLTTNEDILRLLQLSSAQVLRATSRWSHCCHQLVLK